MSSSGESLEGQKFGKLTIERGAVAPPGRKGTWVHVVCECGTEMDRPLTKITRGHTKSCGCLKGERKREAVARSMLGKKFGRLVVLERAAVRKGRQYWKCLCACGSYVEVFTKNLRSGHTQSCGCLQQERAAQNKHRKGKRPGNWKGEGGMSGSHWGRILWAARSRGLKISVTHKYCVALLNKQGERCALTGEPLRFPAIGEPLSATTASLDRIDSTKGYTPDNVQWVHKGIQRMKSDLSHEDFLKWCQKVVEYARGAPPNHRVGP